MKTTVRVEGLRELEKALSELPKSTGKATLRRVLRARAQPIAEAARAKAPVHAVDGGELRDSIAVSTRLSRRQSRLHRRMFKDDRAAVEMFVGAGPLPSAHTQEFGTVNHPPQPFMRPAWDETKDGVLDGIKGDLWAEIRKSAERLARKRAREAAKGK